MASWSFKDFFSTEKKVRATFVGDEGVQHVRLTENDGSDGAIAAKLGSLTETAPASDTASSGLNGRLQRIAQRLTTLIGAVAVMATRQDTYTGAASGTAINAATTGLARHSLQVKGTGAAPTAWNVVYEVSLDNANWTILITHSNTGGDADGALKFAPGGDAYPALYTRSRCVSITLGGASNVVVTIVGLP